MNPRAFTILCALALSGVCAADVTPRLSAEQIMRKVAENQDNEQQARAHFIYDESLRVLTHYTNGKLAREERSEFIVFPKPKGVERKRVSVRGRYWHKGQYVDFAGDPVPGSDTLDGGLTSGFADSLRNNKSNDSMSKQLFPLTSEAQKDLLFELAGEQMVAGREAYRIRFRPKDRAELAWAGEAVIDKQELQPVWIYTRLARQIPFVVRNVLGTDLPGVGFNVRYARVDKDVWFPASFGTEFRLRAVFFFKRNISVSMENKNFKRAAAESQIYYGEPPSQ